MENTFEQQKADFFADLRTDTLIQKLGSEQKIRDLTEKIIMYVNHANEAIFYSKGKEHAGIGELMDKARLNLQSNPHIKNDYGKVEPLLDLVEKLYIKGSSERLKPIVLDFHDVKQIAYNVGKHQDNRNIVKRAFTKQNPLDKLIREYSNNYECYTSGFFGIFGLNGNYFEKDVWNGIAAALNWKNAEEERAKALIEMHRHAVKYINKQAELLRLAESAHIIPNYYAEERQRLGKFNKKDRAWLEPMLAEPELKRRDIKEISSYFAKQAEINGILFKTIYVACSELSGQDIIKATKITEEIHAKLMQEFNKNGYLNVQLDIKVIMPPNISMN